MSNITVSVLVPCYNCEKTIARTIDSIINQTYDNNLISLILCNDGSTDNTLKILKQYQNKYGNKKIIILDKKNEGSSIARKYLLDKCDSKYFMLMDSDDYYVPNAIKQLVNRLDRDVDVVVAKTIILNKHNHQKKIF
jgi:glycosyltransferase involved in cell wall biosynthesis